MQFSIWPNPHWLNLTSLSPQVCGVRLNLPVGIQKDVYGLDLGLVNISKNLNGITIGGLGAGAENLNGIAIGGLMAGAENLNGIIIGGCGAGALNLNGVAISPATLNAGGIAIAGRLNGLLIGGFGAVTILDSTGVLIGGFFAGCIDNITGLVIAGGYTRCKEISGTQISGLINNTKKLKGFQLGTVNFAKGGVQLGIYNHNSGTKSWQFGLLNYNKNGFLPFFPLINFGHGQKEKKVSEASDWEEKKVSEASDWEALASGEISKPIKLDKLGRVFNSENGHWYKRLNPPTSWHQARDMCISNGGYLATITSKEENDFVYEHFAKDYVCWLGASQADSTGAWSWVTRESFEYQNWYLGEPNDFMPNEDYIVIGIQKNILVEKKRLRYGYKKYWNDHQANGKFEGIIITYPLCEWNE